MVIIREAQGPADLQALRELFLEYQGAIGVDLCFQGFAQEVGSLPGSYVRLLLAAQGTSILGCGGLRPLAGTDCGECLPPA